MRAALIDKASPWHTMSIPEKVAEVRRLEANDNTVSEMARSIGISHGGLAGFLWRNGIPISNRRIRVRGSAPLVKDTRPVREDAWDPIGDPVQLHDNAGCCWPVDGEGHAQCGAPKHKKSYCERHYKMAYKPGRKLGDLSVGDVTAGRKKRERFDMGHEGKVEWRKDDE